MATNSRPATPAGPKRTRWRRQTAPAVLMAILVLGAIPILVPFFWMISQSLKPTETATEYPPRWVPTAVTHTAVVDGERVPVTPLVELPGDVSRVRVGESDRLEIIPTASIETTRRTDLRFGNYREALVRGGFGRPLVNTLLISILSVIGQVLTCSLVGYGFARGRFTGKQLLFMIMLATMIIPGQIYAIPQFMIWRQLGWIDTFLPLVVPSFFASAFFVFLFRQFFLSIPLAMDEAATIDGASPLRVYWDILLPLAKPVAVTVGVYTFFGSWNELFGPLIILNSDYKWTLALALTKFRNAYGYSDIPVLMAASALMMLPILVIFFFAQRALVRGLTIGGVKG